jgi:L-threonylcarbamoyladenylate synthase
MVAQVVGECNQYVMKEGEKVRSPGMKYKHYSPNCKTMLFAYDNLSEALSEYNRQIASGVKAYLLCDDSICRQLQNQNVLNLGATDEQIASNLYDKLREAEKVAELIIAIAPQKQDGVMVGVMNRLQKACG